MCECQLVILVEKCFYSCSGLVLGKTRHLTSNKENALLCILKQFRSYSNKI